MKEESESMNATERIEKLLKDGRADRVPVSGWMHMPLLDRKPEEFAEASIRQTDAARFDFLKIMSNAYCMAEAYGAGIDFVEDETRWQRPFRSYPVTDAVSLANIPVLTAENPVFQREAKLIGLLQEHYQGSMPLIATVFNPVTWLKYMADQEKTPVRYFMEEHKKELHSFCERMLQSICNQLDMLMEKGIAGIFLASQFSCRSEISPELFQEFCAPYEKAILQHVKGKTWFNMLHIHGVRDLYFEEVLDYNVEAINWENCPDGVRDDPGIISLAQAHRMTDKVLICGVDRIQDFLGGYEQVRDKMLQRLQEALAECGGERLVFCPGCGIPVGTDPQKLNTMAEAVDLCESAHF